MSSMSSGGGLVVVVIVSGGAVVGGCANSVSSKQVVCLFKNFLSVKSQKQVLRKKKRVLSKEFSKTFHIIFSSRS